MKDIISQLDLLKRAINLEFILREAASTEFNNDICNGPMKIAHDAAISAVLVAAKTLLEKA